MQHIDIKGEIYWKGFLKRKLIGRKMEEKWKFSFNFLLDFQFHLEFQSFFFVN